MLAARRTARKGLTVRTQVLEQTLRAPTAQEARALELKEGDNVIALKRLRSVDGQLRLLVETAVPADLAPGLHRARLENKSPYDVLKRQYGLRIVLLDRRRHALHRHPRCWKSPIMSRCCASNPSRMERTAARSSTTRHCTAAKPIACM